MEASVQANIQPVVTKVTDMVIGGFYFRLFIHTDVYLSLTEGVSLPVANLFILPCYMSPFSTKSEP